MSEPANDLSQLILQMKEVKEEMKKMKEEIKETMTKTMDDISKRIELNEDRVKMLTTDKLARAAGFGEYVPPVREFGPTGHYLVEPRSRWKRTSLYGH